MPNKPFTIEYILHSTNNLETMLAPRKKRNKKVWVGADITPYVYQLLATIFQPGTLPKENAKQKHIMRNISSKWEKVLSELWVEIFSFLDYDSLINVQVVSREFFELSNSDSAWKPITELNTKREIKKLLSSYYADKIKEPIEMFKSNFEALASSKLSERHKYLVMRALSCIWDMNHYQFHFVSDYVNEKLNEMQIPFEWKFLEEYYEDDSDVDQDTGILTSSIFLKFVDANPKKDAENRKQFKKYCKQLGMSEEVFERYEVVEFDKAIL